MDLNSPWNDGDGEDDGPWEPCKRCFGSGEDDDGADCIHCNGYGEVKLR